MMITPLLTRMYRALATYNTSLNNILSITPVKIHVRDVHLNQFLYKSLELPKKKPSAYIRKSIEKKLGYPLKPKQPLPPFFRFMKEVRPSVTAEHPNLKGRDLIPIFTKMWRSLETTKIEKYKEEYKNDLAKYTGEIENYNRTIPDDEKIKMKEKLEEISDRNTIKAYVKKARELDKPKKPQSSFLRYFHEQTDRHPDEAYKDHMKRISLKWQTFDKTTKAKYKTTPEETENYKRAMIEWEAKITGLVEGEKFKYKRKVDNDFEYLDDEDEDKHI